MAFFILRCALGRGAYFLFFSIMTFSLFLAQMLDITPFLSLIPQIGIIAVIVLICVWGLWRLVIPVAIKQWEKEAESRLQRETEMRTYYITEIKALRDESRQDKQLLFTAFQQNTETNVKLQSTLADVSTQLADVAAQLHEVRRDVSDLYRVVGKDKGIIEAR